VRQEKSKKSDGPEKRKKLVEIKDWVFFSNLVGGGSGGEGSVHTAQQKERRGNGAFFLKRGMEKIKRRG